MKKIIPIFFILSALMLSACAKDSSSKESPAQPAPEHATIENWNYPTTQLPENLKLVTQSMGVLRVQVGKFVYESPKESRPWSGWWFPMKDGSLYLNNNSPLRKYDILANALTGSPSKVGDKFKTKSEATDLLPWEGLCDAWSLASVYEVEPTENLMVNNICLTPGDQKALLTIAYKDSAGHLKNNYFGQLNSKGPQSIYNDIYPDQLHRFIQVELSRRKSPFLMDFDAGESIWTVPVYKAELSISVSADNKDQLNVELFLTSPEFQLNPEQKKLNDIGRLGYLFTKRKYTYSLFGSWQGNEFVVNKGVWTGSSAVNHPDYVISLPAQMGAHEENDPSKVSYKTLMDIFSNATVVESCGK